MVALGAGGWALGWKCLCCAHLEERTSNLSWIFHAHSCCHPNHGGQLWSLLGEPVTASVPLHQARSRISARVPAGSGWHCVTSSLCQDHFYTSLSVFLSFPVPSFLSRTSYFRFHPTLFSDDAALNAVRAQDVRTSVLSGLNAEGCGSF